MRAVCVTFVLFALLAVSVSGANTPEDNSSETDNECLLTGLTFTNGFHIIGQFKPNVFHYECSCANPTTNSWVTRVKPITLDPASSVEVKLNGVTKNSKAMGNAISNDDDYENAPDSPMHESVDLQFQHGDNTIIVGVSCNGLSDPPCYYEYEIKCKRPPPDDGGSVVGDPQFVGLRGQSYQVHGVSGEVYSIVSDVDLQYNSRFVFLSNGECPIVHGRRQKGCWSHPGSYLGELGLKTRAGDRIHVTTGDAKTGFAEITVNDRALMVGETVLLADEMGYVSLNNTHTAEVQVGNWDFVFENSDNFVNQKVRVIDARGLRSHGLLGQTWRDTLYPNAIKYIQGQVDDYVIRDGDIFGDNFVYNTFN